MSDQRIPPNSRLKYDYVAIMGDKRVRITRKQRDWLDAKKGGPTFTHWPAKVILIPDQATDPETNDEGQP